MAAEHGELPVDRRGDPFGARLAVDADLDQPAALLVVRLGERVRQRRAAVAHVLRDRLLAVQVAERHVAEPVEQARRDVADAADRDVPLGVAGPSPGHPGVRHHDRAPHAARRGVGPDARRRLAEDGRVSARPVEAGQADRRLQVRHAVDGHRAVVVAQHDRLGERRGPGAQVHAGGVDERAAEPEAARGVVVAADHDHAGAGVAQPHQRLLAERHRVHRGHRAVVDVARDEHGVHPLRARRLHEVIEEPLLRLAQVGLMQRAPEMPVGRVQEPHGTDHSEPPRHSSGARQVPPPPLPRP